MSYKDADLDIKWEQLVNILSKTFQKKPDVKGILYLIGVNELGKGPVSFSKEQKQDLIHIGNCKVLSYSNHYNLNGLDVDGWPHWDLIHTIPSLPEHEQEKYIKWHILEYFNEN